MAIFKKKVLLAVTNLKKNIPFMAWLIEVAEEKIIEHRLLKKNLIHMKNLLFLPLYG